MAYRAGSGDEDAESEEFETKGDILVAADAVVPIKLEVIALPPKTSHPCSFITEPL